VSPDRKPERRAGRRFEKKAAARKRIVEATRRIIAQGGFQAASVAAIARAADVATGAVYLHFADKDALLTEVFRLLTALEVEAVNEAGARGTTATERLRSAVEAFVARSIRGRRQAYALIAEPVAPAIEAERIVVRAAFARVFAGIVDAGILRREFPDQDPAVAAAGIIGAITEALVRPLSPERPTLDRPAEALMREIVAFCLRAVAGDRRPDKASARRNPK